MTTPPKSSAASFIDQIKDEYRQVVAAEGSALPHAIKCGEYLTLAKENLKAEGGGSWEDWLKTNCPEIAKETASLYRRLAKHKSEIRKAKSINEARKLLPKSAKPRGKQATPAALGGVEPAEKPKPKLKDELEVLAADEVRDVLVEAWDGDDEKLAQLAKLIGDHLQKKSVTPLQNSPAPPPPPIRRSLEFPKLS
jgi:hypothetical protein